MSDILKRDNTLWPTLLALRAVTEPAGVIANEQSTHLKLWGACTFQGADDVEIGVTLPWVENEGSPEEVVHTAKAVEYRVTAKRRTVSKKDKAKSKRRKKPPIDPRKLMEGLDRSIKSMLGEEFATRVVFNGALIFEVPGEPKKNRDLEKILGRIKDANGTKPTLAGK
jgi:hypothetical protein